jgi:hypothetical protein
LRQSRVDAAMTHPPVRWPPQLMPAHTGRKRLTMPLFTTLNTSGVSQALACQNN